MAAEFIQRQYVTPSYRIQHNAAIFRLHSRTPQSSTVLLLSESLSTRPSDSIDNLNFCYSLFNKVLSPLISVMKPNRRVQSNLLPVHRERWRKSINITISECWDSFQFKFPQLSPCLGPTPFLQSTSSIHQFRAWRFYARRIFREAIDIGSS